jgi:hypothetical protein
MWGKDVTILAGYIAVERMIKRFVSFYKKKSTSAQRYCLGVRQPM